MHHKEPKWLQQKVFNSVFWVTKIYCTCIWATSSLLHHSFDHNKTHHNHLRLLNVFGKQNTCDQRHSLQVYVGMGGLQLLITVVRIRQEFERIFWVQEPYNEDLRVTTGRDEVEANMNTCVMVHIQGSFYLEFLLKIFFKLWINVLHNRTGTENRNKPLHFKDKVLNVYK